jgi:hypothetical protein
MRGTIPMTLLDAPVYDELKARRRAMMLYIAGGVLAVLFVAWWLVASRPIDWPWNWNAHLFGRMTVNRFLTAVEQNDLKKAYGIWVHDPSWEQNAAKHAVYPYARFEEDFGSDSSENTYGAFHSHQIAAARMYGNVLLVAILVNGRKTGALNLDYDPKAKTLNFSPPDVELYLGP